MEPDKEILLKLWNNKWSRWIMLTALGWQVITGIKEPFYLLYKEVIKPSVIYLSGVTPDPDDISNERHSFISGYYSYEIFRHITHDTYKDFPEGFRDEKDRLESSLLALGIPNIIIINDIDPSKPIDAIEKYQRLRSIVESFLDKRSKNELSAFYLGLNIALLIDETKTKNPSRATIEFYLNDTNQQINIIRSNSPNRISKLQFESLDINECCAGYSSVFANSFLELKKYYGVNIK